MTHRFLRWARTPAGIATLIVGGFAAVVIPTSVAAAIRPAPQRAPISPPSVTVTTCEVGDVTARVGFNLTNTDSAAHRYLVDLEITDRSNRTVGSGSEWVTVGAGRTVSEEAVVGVSGDGSRCAIVSVS